MPLKHEQRYVMPCLIRTNLYNLNVKMHFIPTSCLLTLYARASHAIRESGNLLGQEQTV